MCERAALRSCRSARKPEAERGGGVSVLEIPVPLQEYRVSAGTERGRVILGADGADVVPEFVE
jgi:hypothetical protein